MRLRASAAFVAAPEVVIPNRADIASGMSQAGDCVDINRRIATWKWPGKGAANVAERLVAVDTHDFDQHRAERDHRRQ